MPLRVYFCDECGEETSTLSKTVPRCEKGHEPLDMVERILAPHAKFFQGGNSYRGKSRQKNFEPMMRERAYAHQRDKVAPKLIESLKNSKDSTSMFLRKNGKRVTKLNY